MGKRHLVSWGCGHRHAQPAGKPLELLCQCPSWRVMVPPTVLLQTMYSGSKN